MMPLVAAALLVGIAAQRTLCGTPSEGGDAYHAAVRQAAARLPVSVGSWLAVEAPLPPAATTLLKPNVLVSRRFQHVQTGESFLYLLVQCRDARDMLGHYPPACYVAQGWRQESAQPIDWQSGEMTVHGMTYTYSGTRHELPATLIVENFMILPDGSTGRDMRDVKRVARRRELRHFGAAQVQLVFDADAGASRRAELVQMVAGADREIIDAILQGSLGHE